MIKIILINAKKCYFNSSNDKDDNDNLNNNSIIHDD